MTKFVLRWLQVFALFSLLLYNWIADARPLNGLTTGDISAMFPVSVNPAPYALALWGAIFVLLIGFVIVQLMPGMHKHHEIRRIGPWFVISCLFNIASIVLWHYLYTVPSLIAILLLLLSLIVIYTRTRLQGWSSNLLIRWLVQVPFSIYLGWAFVMMIVRMSAVLYEFNQGGFDFTGTAWTVLMILVAAAVAIMTGMSFRDPAVVLAAVWGLISMGIANSHNDIIFYTAWSASGLLLLMAAALLFGERGAVRRKQLTKAS
jgi:benzodiazapine receptor